MRQLLKAVRRPHVLRDTPLALAIARGYESDEPLEAVRQFVRDTFKEGGMVGRRLLELIERCDFDAELPMAAVAAQLGMSSRQLFRRRREAVRALQRSAEAIGTSNAEPKSVIARMASVVGRTDPKAARRMYGIAGTTAVDEIARLDAAVNSGALVEADLPLDLGKRLLAYCRIARGAAIYGDLASASRIARYVADELTKRPHLPNVAAIRFELAWLDFLDVRFRGRVDAARSIAATLPGLADGDAALSLRALIFLTESYIRCGDVHAAESTLTSLEQLTSQSDAATTALLLCCKGAIAMLRHDFPVVDACYSAAEIVLGRRSIDLWGTQNFVGRARVMLGHDWVPAADASNVEHLEWTGLRIGDEWISLPSDTRYATGRIQVALIGLRAALRIETVDLAGAESGAIELLTLAREQNYPGQVALSLAVLAEIDLLLGRVPQARQRVADAWISWRIVADRVDAVDLFVLPEDAFALVVRDNAALSNAVAARSQGLDASTVQRLLRVDYPKSTSSPDFRDLQSAGIVMLFPVDQRAGAAGAVAMTLR